MSGLPERLVVDVALARELARIASAWPNLRLPASDALDGGMWFGMDEDESRAYADSVRAVIDALGLLPDAAASEWARRFELAVWAPSPGPEPEESQRRAADEHLARLVGELRQVTGMADRGPLLDSLNGALVVYVRSGVLDAAGVAALDAAVEEALGQPIERFELERIGSEDLFDESEAEEIDTSLGAPVRLCPARPERHDGMLVTACVMYEHGFEVLWHRLAQHGFGDPDTLDDSRFEAADDLGGVYSTSASSSGSAGEREGVSALTGSSSCFQPVPARARELRVSRQDAQWVIPLADAG
jgi:hypothetical protein